MTFLNSLFLFALPLIAVPLLLHFLKRRERKVVNWGAMRFLQDAVTDSKRMRMPESLLLLLARCLLVAGLVFALARPLVNWGSSSIVTDRELIVIVDDSLSTARRSDGDPVFDQIRDAAQKLVADSPTDVPFQLMLASGGGRWIGNQPHPTNTASGKATLAELAKLSPTMGTANLLGCVRKAMSAANDRETTTRPRPAQRIVVVTDGTTPAWLDSDQTALESLRSTIDQSKLPVQIQVLEIESTPDSFNNLSVVQVDSDSDRVGVKESVRLRAEIRNTGTVKSKACRLAWKVKNKIKGHSGVAELEPGESTEIFWSTKFKTAGPIAVEGFLEQKQPDDLPEDSIAVKVVEVVDQIPILIVDNQSLSGSADLKSQQVTFLTLALGYQGEEANKDYHSIFAPTIVSAAEVGSEDLSTYSGIIVLGTDYNSSELVDLLLPEVRRGCGAWVVIGSDPDVDAFNTNWFQDGTGLSPLKLVASEQNDSFQESETENEEIRIHPPSDQHPAMRVLSDQERIDLDQVTVKQHAFFQSLLIGDEVSIPLRSNRGEPLVIENSIGQGRVLFQSFPISLKTTNLPVTNGFVVLVQEWLEYLAQPSARNLNLAIGSPLVWKYEDRNARPATLRLPDGSKIDLTEDARSYGVDQSAGTFQYFATRLPGLYTAKTSPMSDASIEIPFYLPPAREELLAQPLFDENRDWLRDIGKFDLAKSVQGLDASAQAFWSQQKSTSSTTDGQPIWQWIVLALVVLLILELLLAGRVGQQRSGGIDSAAQQLGLLQGASGQPVTKTKNKSKGPKKETALQPR